MAVGREGPRLVLAGLIVEVVALVAARRGRILLVDYVALPIDRRSSRRQETLVEYILFLTEEGLLVVLLTMTEPLVVLLTEGVTEVHNE